MTNLARKAKRLAICSLLLTAPVYSHAQAAGPGVPDPAQSTVPEWVPVVGTNNGVPHLFASVTVTVRSSNGTPIAGALVQFDFSGMVDIRLCTALVPGAGVVTCANGFVEFTADANGKVQGFILGAANNGAGLAPGHGLNAGLVSSQGIALGVFTSPVMDHNGAAGGNGMSGADLALSLADVNNAALGGAYVGRSDFSCDGALTGFDLSLHFTHLNRSALGQGSATGCNNGVGDQPYCP